jgi:hypothetical protein
MAHALHVRDEMRSRVRSARSRERMSSEQCIMFVSTRWSGWFGVTGPGRAGGAGERCCDVGGGGPAVTSPAVRHVSEQGPINLGTGDDLTNRELTELAENVKSFERAIGFDAGRPDGTPRKLIDLGRLASLGCRSRTPLREGAEVIYRWFLGHEATP